LKPRIKYQDQDEVDIYREDMATALVVCMGLNPGRIVRTLNMEYTGTLRKIKQILADLKSVVTEEDSNCINRIPTHGCPNRTLV
jgi:hypothetical protein